MRSASAPSPRPPHGRGPVTSVSGRRRTIARALAFALLASLAPARAATPIGPADLNLEPRLFSINLLRFSPTRKVSLLKQYFRKNILKHRELTGAYLETVEHYRAKVLKDFSEEDRVRLLDEWIDGLETDHPDLGPRLDAARLYHSWARAAARRRLGAEERAALASAAEELHGKPKASPWTLLVAGLVANLLEEPAAADQEEGLSPSVDLWAKASQGAQNEDSHLHFVLADLLARTVDRGNVANFCKKVATEYEKALLVSPGDKQLYTAVAGRYHEIYEAFADNDAQLPFWFEELVFKRLIAVEPTNARAHNNLSFLYSQYGVNLKEALKEAQIANQLLPGDPNLLDTLGWAYYKLGDLPKAIEVLEKALELDDSLADIHFHLATALYDSKAYGRAAAEFRATVALDPENAFALNNLAYLFAERGVEIEEGLALVERALSLEPENSAFLDTKGWLLFRAGRYEEAAKFVAMAIARQPEVSELHMHLGEISLALGDFGRASDHFEKALTYDPHNQALARTLARVYALHGLKQGLARFSGMRAVVGEKENFEVFYRAIAEVYQVEGMYPEAIETLAEYAALRPGAPPPLAARLPDAAASQGPGAVAADLRSALAALPPAVDLVLTVERAGLLKLLDMGIRSARLPFPLEPLRPQLEARLPGRLVFAFDASAPRGEGPGLIGLVQIPPEQAAQYRRHLESTGGFRVPLPGGTAHLEVATTAYKDRVLAELAIFGLDLHFAVLEGALIFCQKKSALIDLLDAGEAADPVLATHPAFEELEVRLDGKEDALLLGSIPELLSGPARESLEEDELGLLEKLALIGSRYVLDPEADTLRERSVLFPKEGAVLLTGDAAFAEAFARRSIARFPAHERLAIESTFGLVEQHIEGSLELRGVAPWIGELVARLAQAGIDLPDLDLGGDEEDDLPDIDMDEQEGAEEDPFGADDGGGAPEGGSRDTGDLDEGDEPGIPVPELDGDGHGGTGP